MHHCNWDYLTRIKSRGGLGLKDLKAMNLASLTKSTWKLFKNPTSLIYRVLQAKYFSKTSLLLAPIKSNSSWGWHSIQARLNVVRKGLRRNIGNGQEVRFWTDI